MKNHLQRSFLGIAITVILLLVAHAANAGMPDDRTFPVVGYDKGLILHIGPKTDAEQVVIRFRNQYRDKTGDELTWRVLYDANPHGTIAVCRFRKDGPVFDPRDPHDASIWDDCDPSQQNIALIAGAYLRIPMESCEPPPKGTGSGDTSGPGPKPTPPPAAPASAGAPEDAPTSRPSAPPAESATVPESPSSAAPEVPSASSAPSAAPSASEAPAPSASTNVFEDTPTGTPSATGLPADKGGTTGTTVRTTGAGSRAWNPPAWKIVLYVIICFVGIVVILWIHYRGKRDTRKTPFISTEAAPKSATLPTPDARKGKASRQETHRRIPPPTG